VDVGNWCFIPKSSYKYEEAGPLALFAKGLAWLCKIPKIFFLKININIPTFYITSIIFYHFLNKKKSLQNKKFHFSIQNILTFFLISIKSATIPIHFFLSNHFPNTTIKMEA
jgi:hypothetical protein